MVCRQILYISYYYPFVLCCTDTGQIVNIILFSGPYNLCLPVTCCPVCNKKWTPGLKDLLGFRCWPATTSCQLLFKFDVFTSFEELKLASPALSQQAFLRMLEHRAQSTGRVRQERHKMGGREGGMTHRIGSLGAGLKPHRFAVCP